MREPGLYAIEDGRMARAMADSMAVEGWVATWSRSPEGHWIAEVRGPGLGEWFVGQGLSRVSAIVDAQLSAAHRLGREPWLRLENGPYRLEVEIKTECLVLNLYSGGIGWC